MASKLSAFATLSFQYKRIINLLIQPIKSCSLFKIKSKFEEKLNKLAQHCSSSSKSLFAGFTGAILLNPDQHGNDGKLFTIENSVIQNNNNGNLSSQAQETSKKYIIERENYKVIFVLGGPGVGKGTQCALLSHKYGWIHVSAGDLLRREQARKGSPFGDLIETCIREGNIVPHFVTIALLKAEMELYPPGTVFLIDGFPREIGQAQAFEETVLPMDLVLFFECDEEVMLKRLMQRSKSSGRSDDNIESIMKRFCTYQKTSLPVVTYYEEMGKVRRVTSGFIFISL